MQRTGRGVSRVAHRVERQEIYTRFLARRVCEAGKNTTGAEVGDLNDSIRLIETNNRQKMDCSLRQGVVDDASGVVAIMSEAGSQNSSAVPCGVEEALRDPSKGRYYVAERQGSLCAALFVAYEWSDWRSGVIWWVQHVWVSGEGNDPTLLDTLFRLLVQESKNEGAKCLRVSSSRQTEIFVETCRHNGMSSHYDVFEEDLSPLELLN